MKSEGADSSGHQASAPSGPLGGRPEHGSAWRRRGFRIAAVTLPLVLGLLLEAALRLAQYGYPTSFFLKKHLDEANVLVENPRFGWRFFPAEIARAPQPLMLEYPKPASTVRIFLFGESAAMGDPEPAYGCARQLERILQARHANKHIEVINVAMTAINSHVIREIARDCAGHQGDLWLIYAGNNEVVGPFGAGTVFGPQAPGIEVIRAILAIKRLRTGQLLANLRGNAHAPAEWQGMELFLNNQISAHDPRFNRVHANFSENLSAIVRAGKQAGAKVVLSTMAVNLQDCPPFGSAHRIGLSKPDLLAWEEQFDKGRRAESERRYADALTAYQQAADRDPEFAELIYRRATCQLELNQLDKAKADFELARDLDTLRFRADSQLESAIRETASANQVPLADAEHELAVQSPRNLPGDDYFYDHVHLKFSGNYLLAKLLAAQVERELFPGFNSKAAFMTEAEVAHQLAFTDFDRRRIDQEMRLRLQQPPFSAQSNFQERDKRLERALAAAHSSPADCSWEYRAALVLAPDDWVLRENFGRLLEAMGDRAGATEQWMRVVEELPFEPEGYFHLGNLSYDAGSYTQAADHFSQALKRRATSIESINGLGLVLAAEGRTNEAVAQFQRALDRNPRFSAARVNKAVLLANRGEVAPAISEYELVLQLDTNNVAARINLAKLLFGQGQTNEAVALYTRALELKPDNPIAQFDLGNALSATGRHAEALPHYAAAVEYQPDFANARYNLALELARAGSLAEALPHFAEAVRLRPAAAEVHFNYGVALAKTQHYSEAAEQFQATLKLEPNHPSARSMLNRALQLGSRQPLLP